jgi:hypothetical protein
MEKIHPIWIVDSVSTNYPTACLHKHCGKYIFDEIGDGAIRHSRRQEDRHEGNEASM